MPHSGCTRWHLGIPIGAADRYAVLSASSAADRLAALSEAVDTVAEMVEFQLSE